MGVDEGRIAGLLGRGLEPGVGRRLEADHRDSRRGVTPQRGARDDHCVGARA